MMCVPLSAAVRLAAAAVLWWALPAPSSFVTFTDVTGPSGITFRHTNGAFGKKFLPETLGSGAAFVDIDNDGWQDILLVNGRSWPSHPGPRALPALYRNTQRGSFVDVTAQSGLAVEMYGMGVAAADYDNDGNADVYVTGLGRNYLFRNTGGGKFVDATAAAGVASSGFSTGALWFDYDHDGRLDLFVTHYVEWSAEHDLFCSLDGKTKSYCTPESYKGQSPTLYHNRGNGTFEDVTAKAGLNDPTAKGLGVAIIDYDEDGWSDLVVTNDTQPNRLYRNQRNGTFADVGMTAGIAFNEAGVARAGMGVDTGDFDGSGHDGIVIGNFSNEMMTLYANDGKGLYIDEAPTSTIGKASLLTLTFGCFFFDADLDGRLDIFAANGHVADDINRVQPKVTYPEPAHLFRNLGSRKFEEVTAAAGPALVARVVARGAAYGDIDNDGDLDLLVTTNNGPARLLRNDGGNRNHLLRIRTIGTASNRDGIGAKVTVTVDKDKGVVRRATVKTGSSYLSQSELPLTFGLGSATGVTSIEITWPGGRVDKVPATSADQVLTIQEGKGIIGTKAIRRPS
jgi:hypothetical protein